MAGSRPSATLTGQRIDTAFWTTGNNRSAGIRFVTCLSQGVVDITPVLSHACRSPRWLADEGTPDPVDLDGARAVRAVSRAAAGGTRRTPGVRIFRRGGRETRLTPIRRSGLRGLVPLAEISRGKSGGRAPRPAVALEIGHRAEAIAARLTGRRRHARPEALAKTAKALGLTVPPSVLVRADEVIE